MDTNYSRLKNFYAFKPGASIVQQEFGFYSLDKWKSQGYISDKTDLDELFGYDKEARLCFSELGWCEAPFIPCYKEEILEDRGECELVRDYAGRGVLYFKGRRNGFMPEYVTHPVTDIASWESDVRWRLNPESPERFAGIKEKCAAFRKGAEKGAWICENLIGGYMYLRSLIGPADLLYAFYDQPELIHACMKNWLVLSDRVISEHQRYIELDEVFMAEDICYKSGCLISPDMMKEFLFPYYRELLQGVRSRQKKKPVVQIDTDGNALPVIDIYMDEIGMDYMSPFEAAAGCDVVEVRKKYPSLLIRGGIDKRILAAGRDAIAREVERVMPFMKEHGGYIPTCDHGVPEEVDFNDYMYYRELMKAF